MKSHLAFLLVYLPVSAGLAAQDTNSLQNQSGPARQTEETLTPEAVLAAQVSEIASSTTLSPKTQAKLIASAVRLAVLAATEAVADPAQRLTLALELATAAANAAPQFANAITTAVSSIPSIASINGALTQIKAAVQSGTQAAEEPAQVSTGPVSPRAPTPSEFGGNTGDTVVSKSH